MNNIITNIVRFVVLLTLQVLICNNIHLLGYINPHIYLLAVLLLPLEIPLTAQYLIGFFTGLMVDMFALSLGVHASATLMVIFLRPRLISMLNGGKKADGIDRPIPGVKDFKWLFAYTFILAFIHHFMVILLEAFTFRNFFFTLISALLSTLFTTILILCLEYTSYPINRR